MTKEVARGLEVREGRGGPLDVLEGFYLAHIVHHFHRSGLLECLVEPRSAEWLARRFDYDPPLLSALLQYVAQRTDILTCNIQNKYRLKALYSDYYFLGFQMDKFLGAYGPTVERVEASLRRRSLGRDFVNRKREAEAYHRIQSPPNAIVLEVARKHRIPSVLDLGCGPATLLTTLAATDRRFRGWGIDASMAMCRIARRRIAEARLEDRIRIICADARTVDRLLPKQERLKIEALHCKGLLNELFRHGSDEAAAYLRRLKRLFAGRLLFVVEYYGKLTRVKAPASRYGHTLLHDLIQVLTSQGVPPGDLAGWADVYAQGGCSLEHAYEGDSQGIEWFVHLVRL